MTVFYFPQWQGSFKDNRLHTSAQRLREYVAANFPAVSGSFVDITLDTSDAVEVEDGIIAKRAIIRQAEAARTAFERAQKRRIFVLGGDCGIEIIPVTYLNQHYNGDLALIWIDAHADLNTPETSPSQTFHGMPLRVILGEGDEAVVRQTYETLKPEQVFLVGVREFDPPEKNFVDQQRMFSIPDVSPRVIQEMLIPAIRARGYQYVYIHFDLDALDPQEFSYIDYPTPKGISLQTALDTVQTIADSFNVVGMSITEYSSEAGRGLDLLAPLLGFFAQQSLD
jgi:arginase